MVKTIEVIDLTGDDSGADSDSDVFLKCYEELRNGRQPEGKESSKTRTRLSTGYSAHDSFQETAFDEDYMPTQAQKRISELVGKYT